MKQIKKPAKTANSIRRTMLSIATGSLIATGNASAEESSQGLLLLHSEAAETALAQALPRLKDLGCDSWHQGRIAGANGNLELGSQSNFVLLACREAVLGSVAGRAALNTLQTVDEEFRAVEGPLLFRIPDEAGKKSRASNDYIFKISHYNNQNPSGREDDLEKINALAAGRKDAWTNEAFIAGLHAVGMPTPDEVVMIRYDDPQQGERFRNNNKDVLQEIGAFNKTHLLDFTYISVAPDR